MKVKRKIIEIDEELCDGCGQCIPSCAEGAIELIDGKAKIVAEIYCDGLGACVGECPTGALTIVEREADEFDEEAVSEYLSSKKHESPEEEPVMACGCPSSQIQSFQPVGSCAEANRAVTQENILSELTHWPVQIRLIPPTAPFLRNADILIAADCTAIACPSFHKDFIKHKAVLIGCPKFDDADEYIEKFTDIFRTAEIRSITVLVMEVPCCHGLPFIVEKGLERAGKKIPIERIVISTQGAITERRKMNE
ncbi:MAG: 4Fe-4S binding protein [Deltaproteobacteria bacterium]|nr:4Fe-4S binding protein [Deltaproteobacteria bacterium]